VSTRASAPVNIKFRVYGTTPGYIALETAGGACMLKLDADSTITITKSGVLYTLRPKTIVTAITTNAFGNVTSISKEQGMIFSNVP
jgi:hypothetical protein